MKHELSILGVPGQVERLEKSDDLWSKQEWVSERRTGKDEYGQKVLMHAVIRFDDNCGNGHNSFSITGYGWYDHYKARDWDYGGCCHETIAKVFPELEPLIKWHLMNSDGPMHYIGNVTYHASDRDHYGLLKGEKRQMLAGGKTPMWNLRADATGCKLKSELKDEEDITCLPLYRLQDLVIASEEPTEAPELFWEPCWRVGEGKERDFAAARSTAVWPEATDEQLSLPKEELASLLEQRLPGLIEAFRADVKAANLFWSPVEMTEAMDSHRAGEIGG